MTTFAQPRVILLALALVAAAAAPALACPVCFGDPASLQFKATQMGVLALLGVTGAVLAGFGAFFLHLRRRILAAEMAQAPAALQQGAHGGSY